MMVVTKGGRWGCAHRPVSCGPSGRVTCCHPNGSAMPHTSHFKIVHIEVIGGRIIIVNVSTHSLIGRDLPKQERR
jgi:hypothetical protein